MGKIYKNGIEYGGGGGDSAGHIILDTDGTAMAEEPNLQFKGLNVTDNSTDEVTEVESVGLNQDSMDDVLNASIPGNQVASNGLVYSTEEQVVGKWIDGKPLYQKTLEFTTPSTATDTTVLTVTNSESIAIQNIIYGTIKRADGGIFPVNFAYPGQGFSCYFVTNGNVTVMNFKTTINTDFSRPATVTIQYTKTS